MLEPGERFCHRELVDLGRALARVDRPRHQRHRARRRGMLVLRHDRDGGERLHARLANGQHMSARPDLVEKADEVVDIVVDAELALRQRHLARIYPVGDVDVVVAQQRFDRVAQERREMARQRRHHQDAGLGAVDVLGEAQQLAEGQVERDLLGDRHIAVADAHAGDAELRARMRQLETRDHFEPSEEARLEGLARGPEARQRRPAHHPRPCPERRDQVVLELVGMIEQGPTSPVRFAVQKS